MTGHGHEVTNVPCAAYILEAQYFMAEDESWCCRAQGKDASGIIYVISRDNTMTVAQYLKVR
jgi:hypothetical protein